MYEYIKGEVSELTPAYVVIEAAGVGYFINISLQTFAELEGKPSATVYIHFIVREDVQVLYGFANRPERDVFRQLISVSGVGGNTARMILSTYTPRELSNIIVTENDAMLKKVKGLGLKTSQKIIVELKDKIQATVFGSEQASPVKGTASGMGENYEEALAALIMLGFPKNASDKAVRNVLKETPEASVEEIVRLSLKKL